MDYTPSSKQPELYDPQSRYVLCLSWDSTKPIPTANANGQIVYDVEREEELLGFASVRFDEEESGDDDNDEEGEEGRMLDVLYM